VIEPLELVATSAGELDELVAFCHSSGLEVLAVVVLATPIGGGHRDTQRDEGAPGPQGQSNGRSRAGFRGRADDQGGLDAHQGTNRPGQWRGSREAA